MRKKTLFLATFIFAIGCAEHASAQVSTTTTNPERIAMLEKQIDLHFTKGKKQKVAAWIMLGAGAAADIIGSSLNNNDNSTSSNSNAGATIAGLGALSMVGSIPVFFSASKNSMKSRLAQFEKSIETAANENDRKEIVNDVVSHLQGRATANRIPAIVLSAGGGVLAVVGIIVSGNRDRDNYEGWFTGNVWGPVLIVSGISYAAISIPFYVRAGQYKRSASRVLESGKVPDALFTISPAIHAGPNYAGIGMNISIGK
ncbi:MAG TPA: hypothetical protein PLM81_08540 [Ginsengibacter sp.]|nr:hypothetical protein [Ginsengibacter sp.]HRP18015.1 hypothetical protein [Ginsengibacter sp.]HRP44911.1 hypothetical protein [Ginsengibacter sp.]